MTPLNSGEPNWMRQMAVEATADMMTEFAALVAAFYNGLRANGLTEAAAVLLTQSYITATAAAASQRPGQEKPV